MKIFLFAVGLSIPVVGMEAKEEDKPQEFSLTSSFLEQNPNDIKILDAKEIGDQNNSDSEEGDNLNIPSSEPLQSFSRNFEKFAKNLGKEIEKEKITQNWGEKTNASLSALLKTLRKKEQISGEDLNDMEISLKAASQSSKENKGQDVKDLFEVIKGNINSFFSEHDGNHGNLLNLALSFYGPYDLVFSQNYSLKSIFIENFRKLIQEALSSFKNWPPSSQMVFCRDLFSIFIDEISRFTENHGKIKYKEFIGSSLIPLAELSGKEIDTQNPINASGQIFQDFSALLKPYEENRELFGEGFKKDMESFLTTFKSLKIDPKSVLKVLEKETGHLIDREFDGKTRDADPEDNKNYFKGMLKGISVASSASVRTKEEIVALWEKIHEEANFWRKHAYGTDHQRTQDDQSFYQYFSTPSFLSLSQICHLLNCYNEEELWSLEVKEKTVVISLKKRVETGNLRTEDSLKTQMTNYAQEYLENIKKSTCEFDKWMSVARFWGKIERLHPYTDGNTRTAWILVWTLLRDLGYSLWPCCWSPVTNYSLPLEESILSLARGMRIFLEKNQENLLEALGKPDLDIQIYHVTGAAK